MSAEILKGAPVAEKIRAELAPEVDGFRAANGVAPTLAVVRVGNPPAAVSYTHSIDRAFTASGMGFQMHVLPEDAGTEQLISRLNELARAEDVHGILLQRPLPKAMDLSAINDVFPYAKDVEGFTPTNIGHLALNTGDYFPTTTPSAAIELLAYYKIPLDGRLAVVVGRSNILGKPMGLLLLQANATVITCHSHTPNLGDLTRLADVLVAAVGRAKLITADMVKPGTVVVDFGVNASPRGGRLVGDVDFERVKEIASAITPVPGGTGPITTVMLMRNTIHAAQKLARPIGTKGRLSWLPTLKSPNRRK